MRAAFEPGAITDPYHMRAAIEPVAGQRIAPRHRLFVRQQQRLVTGVKTGPLQLRHSGGIDAARLHEIERFRDAVGGFGKAVCPRAASHEIKRPLMDLPQIGIATAGKGAQQVECTGRLRIGTHHAFGIIAALGRIELDTVDVIAEIAGQCHTVLRFSVGAARLGELARHAPYLHHRQLASECQHHSHLQQYLEGIANIVWMKFSKAFGAITALQ